MRINVFIAKATGLSRRAADRAIMDARVRLNDRPAQAGDQVSAADSVTLDGNLLATPKHTVVIMLNKPTGYVVSRVGQGSKTVYSLLPAEYRRLKPVGRLDKDSSGLLLLTDDGGLANQLTHPRNSKTKVYEIVLDKALAALDGRAIEGGIELDDGLSALQLARISDNQHEWRVTMSEGRNRQIRRTFAARGYTVVRLHRTEFGDYRLPGNLRPGQYITAED